MTIDHCIILDDSTNITIFMYRNPSTRI